MRSYGQFSNRKVTGLIYMRSQTISLEGELVHVVIHTIYVGSDVMIIEIKTRSFRKIESNQNCDFGLYSGDSVKGKLVSNSKALQRLD